MKTNARTLKERGFWNSAEVKLPEFDWGAMCAETGRNPVWVHFGAGNIFRGFIAKLQQDLLNAGLAGKVTEYFRRMLAGPGAVRATLEELV